MFIASHLHSVMVIMRLRPWECVEKLEADDVEVLEIRDFPDFNHIACVPCYVEHKSVFEVFASAMLHFD